MLYRLSYSLGVYPNARAPVGNTAAKRGMFAMHYAPLARVSTTLAVLLTTAVARADQPAEPRQHEDGRIVFAAGAATIDGSTARLETDAGRHRIAGWTNPTDTVSWTWKPTRWGAYDAHLVCSTAAPSGIEIEVTVGDTPLTARLESTGARQQPTTLPLGRVVIPTAGQLTVRMRCMKLPAPAGMSLDAITLTPACEGTPPRQATDGSILLHGRDATIRGTMLRWEPAEKKQTLGFWTRATDAAEWAFTIDRPGTFAVEVLQGCGTGQGGSEMGIAVDPGRPTAASLAFTVEDTGGFQAFKPRTVGRVTLDAAGEHVLRVQPKRIAKAAACDIRQIRLMPVEK